MKKKTWIKALSIAFCALTAAAFASCGGAVTLEEFDANEATRYVEVGENYSIPKPIAKDSKGNYLVPEVSVKDPTGANVDVDNFKFKPTMVGNYEITFSVTVGNTTETKSFTLEVFDETEPLVDIPLMWYNIAMPGATLDISTITATDNSGEAVTPEVTVYFNDAEVEADNGVVTFSEVGTYIVNVKATDTTGNEEERDYVVYTNVSYEDGIYVENQWYVNRVSSDIAYNGEKSMEISLFANQSTYNWFNDSSMLGELYFYGHSAEREYKYLSYWIYFDFDAIEAFASAVINGSWYKIVNVYDEYGDVVEKRNDKYEFDKNAWYRIVTDITTIDNPVDHAEAAPITDCLMDYGVYFGLWNIAQGDNLFDRPVDVYIDDIRFIDIDNDDEVYKEKPVDPTTIYEKGDRLGYVIYSQMVYNVGTAENHVATLKNGEDELVSYTFKHGMVEGTLSEFDEYGPQAIGSDTAGFLDGSLKKAQSSGWQIFTGNNDGFVYEITAKKTVYVDLKAQIKDVDGAENNMAGWIDNTSSCQLRVYVKDADGNLEKLYDFAPNGASGVDEDGDPTGYEITNVLLQEGETLYYEYTFPYQDHRNMQNPPYINVYEATLKA